MDTKSHCLTTLDTNLYNLYGPTEACIDATYWACQRSHYQSIVPIGHPIANTRIYILDNNQQPVPIGIPGELHIGGVALARGYLNRPELTSKKFIEAKLFGKTERIYKTGDIARWFPDGSLDYLGRMDHQIKLRGFRIELGEIESLLKQYPGINEVIVMTQEYQSEDIRLIAYLTHIQDIQPDELTLRLFLKKKLPEYMLPSAFVILDTLPLTTNGKIDRNALPLPDKSSLESTVTYVAPRSPIEEMLTGIWQEILNINQVGIHDNFFEIGGHSLLAMQLNIRINKQFQIDFPLYLLFDKPTVAELSVQLKSIQNQEKIDTPPQIKALPRKRSNSNIM